MNPIRSNADKLRKTPLKNRSTYSYQFFDEKGNPEPCITIRPGENDVTEIDIKRLHAADDSDVYFNLKSRRPNDSKTNKAKKVAWAQQFASDFIAAHGYVPNARIIEDACASAFPTNWCDSLDAHFQNNDENEGSSDKRILRPLWSHTQEETLPVERMQELVDCLSAREQIVYRRVLLNGETNCEVARDLGISDVSVSRIAKKIKAYIAEDKILQGFFR